ncbi:helix-turn-helix domain-containing protein [Desulfovibrio piger]|nr:helix-turn-helix domain-containing protein [Desulfovibrio piger]
MDNMGDRIRKIRGRMTQKEFSERIGITQRAVINYEISGRTPRRKIIKAICEQFGICEHWLLTGEGPMQSSRADKKGEDICDTVAGVCAEQKAQSIENIQPKKGDTCDMSQVSPLYDENRLLYQKNMGLQERIASLLEEKAELQVALERVRMDVERRDQRIRELEKENAQLREARKGAAYPGAEIAGVAG